MYNSWRNIPPCDMPNYLAYLRKQQGHISGVRTTATEATEKIMRRPNNLPNQQPNEWVKVNGKWVVSPENYND